jgi:hypothetical protein
MTKIECERDDSAFMLVDETARLAPPARITSNTSASDETYTSVRPLTYTPRALSSWIERLSLCGASRSLIFSM